MNFSSCCCYKTFSLLRQQHVFVTGRPGRNVKMPYLKWPWFLDIDMDPYVLNTPCRRFINTNVFWEMFWSVRLQNILKTSWRHIAKMNLFINIRLRCTSWRAFEGLIKACFQEEIFCNYLFWANTHFLI